MELPLHSSCKLLKSAPSGLLAVEKTEGILSHPNPGKSGEICLLDATYDPDMEVYQKDGQTWYLLNRLDGPTSGLILLAENRDIAKAVKDAFARHVVRKTYFALVKGIPPRKKDTWRDCLKMTRKGGALRTAVVPGRPDSEACMQLQKRGEGIPARALITLQPATGRTHQLRVQCASRHLPIIGDGTYGDFSFNREFKRRTGLGRLFLHSRKISLEVELSGKKVSFSAESPLPEAFAIALR